MHSYVLWACLMAYGLHMIEETVLDWHGWVQRVMHLPAKWSEFYLVNAIVVVLGIGSASVGWRAPAIALIFPAFMVFNGIAFHIVPILLTRIFSPGIFTTLALFLPVGAWTYVEAANDGAATTGAVAVSSVLGVLAMLFPIVLQKVKDRPIFVQTEPSSDVGAQGTRSSPSAAIANRMS